MNNASTQPQPTADSNLAQTRQYLDQLLGSRQPIDIRTLMGFWGFKGRGKHQVAVVEADLAKIGLVTAPPFDSGRLDSLVLIEAIPVDRAESAANERPEDHLLPLAAIESANVAIRTDAAEVDGGFVSKDQLVSDAVTIMLRHDYSQLPVVESLADRSVVGVFSWETYGRTRLQGKDPLRVADALESVPTVDLHSDVFDSVQAISNKGFVVVTYRGLLAGIVTASDLTQTFKRLAIPFLAVGRCEQELKRVAKLLIPSDENKPIDGMMFGQLQRHYETKWELLKWSISKELFLGWLDATRALRNSIAHFDDQDVDRTPEVEDVHRLTEWLRSVDLSEALEPGQGKSDT